MMLCAVTSRMRACLLVVLSMERTTTTCARNVVVRRTRPAAIAAAAIASAAIASDLRSPCSCARARAYTSTDLRKRAPP
eukprot:2242141-Pleurochrysis_carterae.AAC.5